MKFRPFSSISHTVNFIVYFSSVTSAPADAVYPDTVAISIDDEACKLTCIYNDHSLYIWDIHDIKRIGKCRSFLYHSAAIWGVEVGTF